MLRLKIIAILWCVLVGMQAHTQGFFNLLDTTIVICSDVIVTDGSYYCAGTILHSLDSRSITLIKYNNSGQEILRDTLSSSDVNTLNSNLVEYNGNIFLYNIVNETIPYTDSNNSVQLHKMDANFNMNFSFLLGGSGQDIAKDILAKNDNLYLMGSTDSFGEGLGDFYLIKTDTSGNVLWDNTYGSAQNEIGFSITPTQDGNLLLSGHKNISSTDWDIYLVMVDTSGNLLWEKNYGTPWNDYGGLAKSTHDHSFIVYRNTNDGNGGPTVGYVEKLDGKGNIIWSKSFPFNSLSSFSLTKAIENSDGTYLVMASVKNAADRMIGKAYKLDAFGNILWTKEYFTDPTMNQYIYDIKPTEDGGYIMCGSARNQELEQNGWLIKTNCNGEEGVQHPITATPCEQYDCTLYPIDASFSSTGTTIDLADGGVIQFENNSANATSRVWNFGDGEMEYTDSLLSHTFTQTGTYEVQLVVFHGMCSDTMTQTIEVINTTGIEDLVLETGMSIFPNPSKESFTVRFKNSFEGKMNIIDLLGRNYSTTNISKETQSYTFSNLPKGIYLVEVEMNNGRKEVKRIEVI